MNLITPLLLDSSGSLDASGTSYCANQGGSRDGGWRTDSFLTGQAALNTSEDDDKWVLVDTQSAPGAGDFSGAVKFGTNCIQSVTFKFITDIDNESDTISITIAVNGLLAAMIILVYVSPPGSTDDPPFVLPTGPYYVGTLLAPGQENSLTVTLTSDQLARPCGNIFEISVDQSTAAHTGVSTYMEVTAVT